MKKRATALLVCVVLGFGVASCDGNNRRQAADALLATPMGVLIAIPAVPALLIYCAAGGCNKESEAKAEKMRAEPKYAETKAHLRAEAEKGDPGAQSEMGTWYESEGNFTEAATWYRKSADQGWGNAQFHLGVIYERGLGVQPDNVQADAWYCIAAKSEKSTGTATIDAAIYRDDIEKKMTPEQIAEARRRAQEWKPTPSGASAQAQPANSAR